MEKVVAKTANAAAKVARGGRFAYKRTIDSLKADVIKLPDNVQELSMTIVRQGEGHTGPRFFLYEKIPPIKFHNPDLKVHVTRKNTGNTWLKLRMKDGFGKMVKVTGLQMDEIQTVLTELSKKPSLKDFLPVFYPGTDKPMVVRTWETEPQSFKDKVVTAKTKKNSKDVSAKDSKAGKKEE
eukprot:Colp12_sorted_trinity150504_noHs@731